MLTNTNTWRTVGPQTAHLLNGLYDKSQSTFTLADVQAITKLSPKLATGLVNKAIHRGLFSRLKGGLYVIIPPEFGAHSGFAGNPLLVAQHVAAGAPGFVSHASAMEVHRMVTQPQFVFFWSSLKRIRPRTIHGTEYRFVVIKPENLFGTTRHWVTKQEWVEISDLERTILDGLRQPEYCGGITEVAKGLWMRREDISVEKLVHYCLRLNIGAVASRLGHLLEVYAIATRTELDQLSAKLNGSYAPLDPTMPKEGPFLSRWKIQSNVDDNELLAVRNS